eukprot:9163695-Karenia_brevis.AAC.1
MSQNPLTWRQTTYEQQSTLPLSLKPKSLATEKLPRARQSSGQSPKIPSKAWCAEWKATC